MDGPITEKGKKKCLFKLKTFDITMSLQTLDCDWTVDKFIEVNFLKLTENNKIFRNDFGCIQYHLCKISSQIIECKIFAPFHFLEVNSR